VTDLVFYNCFDTNLTTFATQEICPNLVRLKLDSSRIAIPDSRVDDVMKNVSSKEIEAPTAASNLSEVPLSYSKSL
jgi:hypothetical protein